MPFATGTANNPTELRTAMINLATANGWTWDATYEMLHKAPVYGKLTATGNSLFVQSALGYSGSTLTTPAAQGTGISEQLSALGIAVLNYPVTYRVFVHTAPDDIVLSVNYGTVWWQWLMFGNSTPLGDEPNPLWQWGSAAINAFNSGVVIRQDGESVNFGENNQPAAPFYPWFKSPGVTGGFNSAMYANIDGMGWGNNRNQSAFVSPNNIDCAIVAAPILQAQPNQWNGEAELVRLTPMVSRPSNFYSYIADLSHVRIARNDNFSDGQIITIGPDKWFVAPCFRKDSANRNDSSAGGTGIKFTHSGTMALAIRYDGP